MSRFHHTTLALSLVTLLALPFVAAAPATAGTERYTTISTLPYTISTPGGYKLTSNITATTPLSTAILITCDNVVLDFDGFTITYAPGGGAIGVCASGQNNITIRNGKLRKFFNGMNLTSGFDLVVENMDVMESTAFGIGVHGTGGVVRGCKVFQTGLVGYSSTAIRMSGTNGCALDNVVMRIYGTSSIGIDMSNCLHAVVERNVVANEWADVGVPTIGIKLFGPNGVVVGNRVCHFGTGISMGGAISYRDNFVSSVGVAEYVGGSDEGNNF